MKKTATTISMDNANMWLKHTRAMAGKIPRLHWHLDTWEGNIPQRDPAVIQR